MNMKNFKTGILTGVLLTVGTLATAFYGVKKIVIEPIEEKEAMIEDSKKKANRRSFAR